MLLGNCWNGNSKVNCDEFAPCHNSICGGKGGRSMCINPLEPELFF